MRLKFMEQRLALAFVESGERRQVGSPIAVLRVKAGHIFSRMVRTDDERAERGGDVVLNFHPLACFRVPFMEVTELKSGRLCERFSRSVDGRLHVDRERLVRTDEFEGALRIRFVMLFPIWKTDGVERVIRARFLTQLFHRLLTEFTGERRVLSTRDAKDESFRPGPFHISL